MLYNVSLTASHLTANIIRLTVIILLLGLVTGRRLYRVWMVIYAFIHLYSIPDPYANEVVPLFVLKRT